MPPVFLDTNVLPRNLHHTQQNRALIELVEAGLIEVYLSTIVIREWKSQRIHDFDKMLRDTMKGVRAMRKHSWSGELGDVAAIEKQLDDMCKQGSKVADGKCDEFLNQLKAKELPFNGDAAGKVFDSYFSGGPPFGSPKNRKDIPHAFILQALCDMGGGEVFASLTTSVLGRLPQKSKGSKSLLMSNPFMQNLNPNSTSLEPWLHSFAKTKLL